MIQSLKKSLFIISLIFFGFLSTTALSQQSVQTIEADSEAIKIEIGEGKLIKLPRAASNIFIANPAVADLNVKSARLVYVFGIKSGTTSLFAVDGADQVIASIPIKVSHNLAALDEALEKAIPGNNIEATSITSGILLTGEVKNLVDVDNAGRIAARFIDPETERIISQMNIAASDQVHLRVRIAEVRNEVIDQFGFNWSLTSFNDGTTTIPLTTTTSTVLATTPPNFLGITSTVGKYFNLDVLIDALAQDELVTILAEPNLTAVSGETATFLAGGEFPVPVGQEVDEGNRVITIEFKEFGVSLAFTPTIIGENRISLRVRPEVSQLSSDGAVILGDLEIPALSTRRAETTVDLGSGQSFAIAGLILNNQTQVTSKVPGLGDIPILGRLFKSERFQNNESELVIVVTPYLVTPSNRPIALPTDPYTKENVLTEAPSRLAGPSTNAPTNGGEDREETNLFHSEPTFIVE
ncbi:type II and III secretion system protein family protein [Kiloniella laminariae]|uniref:Type II and III secretion system protein family protein n=1 Tax=Kiloniella laminariae TaxID=454162 RepID=A0ABT4LLI2_9PROT|nr:type II and III secretion system protein family protein [Kiloniella laminariae]MCZ4281942.1 type II and III secretion system protein family protein [Kiloniella laminariae]